MKKKFFWVLAILAFLASPSASFAEATTDYIANGERFVQEKNYKEAIQEYQKALAKDPGSARINLILGLCYTQSGDMDSALSHVQAAAKLTPSYPVFFNLGLIHAIRKEFSEALQAYDQAEKMNEESFEVAYQKGLVQAALEHYEEAAQSYRKALELNPAFDNARLALFGILWNQGDRQGALAQIEEFRKMKKDAIAQVLEARMKSPNP